MRAFASPIARLALIAAIALAAWSQPARAQRTPQTVVRGGANGLKVGEARMHPFVDVEPRLDTAAGFFPGSPTAALPAAPSPEVVLHVRPGIRFELPSGLVAIDVTANADYLYYTGILSRGSTSHSRLQGAASVNAGFNRSGAIGFDLGDQFSYSDRTTNTALGVGVLSLANEVNAQLGIRPGGGALDITPRVAFGFENYRPVSSIAPTGCSPTDITCQPALVASMNYQNIRFGAEGRWRFLPKTALVLETSFDGRGYTAAGNTNQPARLLKASAGLQGLLTSKISVVAKAGWAYDFAAAPASAPGSNANTFLGHAEATYLLNDPSNVKVGYFRSIEPVAVYGTFRDDRLYGELRLLFSGSLVFRAYTALDFLTFGLGSNRLDTSVLLDPSVEYELAPWLFLATGYSLTVRASQGASSAINYNRHEAYVRLTAAY